MHAALGQQVYVTVDTGGHMASPAQVYFDQVSTNHGSYCSYLQITDVSKKSKDRLCDPTL